jgi:molecular chaperone DnaJ
VATLEEPVTLKIPAGTQPGTTMRVRGRGVPGSAKHPHGDLLVSINVEIPKKLNKEQRTLVEKLAVALHEEAS